MISGTKGLDSSRVIRRAPQFHERQTSPLINNGVITIKTVLLAANTVPEPATAVLMVFGLALLLVVKQKRLLA